LPDVPASLLSLPDFPASFPPLPEVVLPLPLALLPEVDLAVRPDWTVDWFRPPARPEFAVGFIVRPGWLVVGLLPPFLTVRGLGAGFDWGAATVRP